MTLTTNVVTIGRMALGLTVKRLREAAGLTQTQLAERAGMEQQALAALEKRDSKSSSFSAALAYALGVPVAELLDVDEPRLSLVEEPSPTALGQEELIQLITLYGSATKIGREQIMRMARSVEKHSESRSAISAGD